MVDNDQNVYLCPMERVTNIDSVAIMNARIDMYLGANNKSPEAVYLRAKFKQLISDLLPFMNGLDNGSPSKTAASVALDQIVNSLLALRRITNVDIPQDEQEGKQGIHAEQ